MSWRQVWHICFGYDTNRQHVPDELRHEFEEAVARRASGSNQDDEYLGACAEVLSDGRYILKGRHLPAMVVSAEEYVGCVRSLQDVYVHNAHDEIVTRGEAPLDFIEWFHSKFRAEYMTSTLRGGQPLLWITTSSELDELERAEPEPERRGDRTRDHLGLEHEAGNHYVRFDIPATMVSATAHKPTTFDGGVRSLFVPCSDDDAQGWGRAVGAGGKSGAREAVTAEVPCCQQIRARYFGTVRTPLAPIDPAQRADMLRERLKP